MTVFVSFYPFLLLFAVAFGSATPIRDECEGDIQCVPGYFCFKPTKFCSKCTECEVYKRNNVVWRSCAKDPSECGSCLPGYEEEILSGGRTRDFCVKSLNQAAAQLSDNAQSKINLSWPVGIGFALMLTFFYAACWKNWKSGNSVAIPAIISRSGAAELAAPGEEPPPYSSSMSLPMAPTAPVESLNDECQAFISNCQCSAGRTQVITAQTSHTREHCQSWQQCKEDSLQQAVPFRNPDNPQSCLNSLLQDTDDESGSPDDNDSFSEEVQHPGEANIDLEDETTMPSDWTPYPYPQDCSPINEDTNDGCNFNMLTESNESNNNIINNNNNNNNESIEVCNDDTSEPPAKKKKEDNETATVSPEKAGQ